MNGEIAQWTAVGRWARANTAPNAVFLIPTSDFRAEAVRPVQTDPGAQEYEIFEYVSHRRVWVDFVRGAAVLWSPSYYPTWRQRLPEVLQLRSLSQKMSYAASHDIDYVVSDCSDAVPSTPVFQFAQALRVWHEARRSVGLIASRHFRPMTNSPPPIRRGAGPVRRRLDPEVVELFAGPELRSEPSRLLAAAGPGLGGFGGVSIFGKHLGVGTPRMVQLFGARPVILAKLV